MKPGLSDDGLAALTPALIWTKWNGLGRASLFEFASYLFASIAGWLLKTENTLLAREEV